MSRAAVLASVRRSLAARGAQPLAEPPGSPPGSAHPPPGPTHPPPGPTHPPPGPTHPPPRPAHPPRSEDAAAAFARALAEAGGETAAVGSERELAAALAARRPRAVHVLSWVEGVPSRGRGTEIAAEPRACAGLDLAVGRAAFAVAENGAVWVAPDDPVRAAALFLAEHVVLAVGRDEVVADMAEAYERIAAGPLPEWGCFVAGPSKTADIEQCLVVGAHGPRSLWVALLGSATGVDSVARP